MHGDQREQRDHKGDMGVGHSGIRVSSDKNSITGISSPVEGLIRNSLYTFQSLLRGKGRGPSVWVDSTGKMTDELYDGVSSFCTAMVDFCPAEQ